ncbi:MazG-like family protein [Streptomyces sp. NPDC006784]|uniref:MazG-like family protein n=1 Tax=Streptomyces sp. NPDC006784 TaxID=3364764 RepID=UPI0036ABAC6A
MGDVTSQKRTHDRVPESGSHPPGDAESAPRDAPGHGAEGGSGRPGPDDGYRQRGEPRDVWSVAAELARTFDAHGDAQGMTREQQWTLQVLKLAEETGEAAQAVIGVQGTNPRKGHSHAWEDVQAEVADVVITGLVALARMRPEDAAEYLQRQLAQKAARFPATGRPGREPSAVESGRTPSGTRRSTA